MELIETRIDGEYIYQGRILNLRRDRVTLPNGNTVAREVVEHKGGVTILALDDNDHVILVRQHRYSLGKVIFELPAGKMDKEGESPLECAMRELKEETGYAAKSYLPLGFIYPSPGFLNERVHLFLATGLEKGETAPDDDEFVESLSMPFPVLIDMIMKNEINDAKTVAAVLKAARLLGK